MLKATPNANHKESEKKRVCKKLSIKSLAVNMSNYSALLTSGK